MRTQTLLTWMSGALLIASAIPSAAFALSSAPIDPSLSFAGKGTIGIVCQGADGMIQAVQPIGVQSLNDASAPQAIRDAEAQIQERVNSEDQVQSMNCGVQVIDPALLRGMPPQGMVTPPSGEGPILPVPGPMMDQSGSGN